MLTNTVVEIPSRAVFDRPISARLAKVGAFNIRSDVWNCETNRVPQQRYTPEFRELAAHLVLTQERAISDAARRLAMSQRCFQTELFGCAGTAVGAG